MVVALNKCDLIPAEERTKTIKKACKRLAQTFDFTKFAGVKMIPVMARPGEYWMPARRQPTLMAHADHPAVATLDLAVWLMLCGTACCTQEVAPQCLAQVQLRVFRG
jgi:hypothetical protein